MAAASLTRALSMSSICLSRSEREGRVEEGEEEGGRDKNEKDFIFSSSIPLNLPLITISIPSLSFLCGTGGVSFPGPPAIDDPDDTEGAADDPGDDPEEEEGKGE